MMVEPRSLGAEAVVDLAPACQRYQQGSMAIGLLPYPSRHLVAVHPGHADIEKHNFGPEGLGFLQSGWAVESNSHLLAFEPQQDRQTVRRVLFIVHDQDPPGM